MLHRFLHRGSELSCKDVNAFLVAYGEGILEDGLRERFENHLERCPCCKTYLVQYQTTVALVKEAGEGRDIRPHEDLVQLTLAFLRESLTDSGEGREE